MSISLDGVHTKAPGKRWRPSEHQEPMHGSGDRLGSELLVLSLGPALIAAVVLLALAAGTFALLAVLAAGARGWLP